MGTVRAEIHLQDANNVPENGVVNVFYFSTVATPPSVLELNSIASRLTDFYQTNVPATGTSMGVFIDSSISRQALVHQIRLYNNDNPGPPMQINGFTLAGPAGGVGGGLPREVAVALTFHGDLNVPEFLGNTRPRARRRGRVYIGPLTDNGNTRNPGVAPSYRVQVSDVIRDFLALDAGRLLSANNALASWAVYSRTTPALFNVVGGWVDDAFDIQRRRGQRRVNRLLWP